MTIIEIAALPNGAHRNQTCPGIMVIPDGWAVVPDELMGVWEDAAPFVDITVSGDTVTEMRALEPPDPEPVPETEPDTLEQRISDLEDAVVELAAIIAEGE